MKQFIAEDIEQFASELADYCEHEYERSDQILEACTNSTPDEVYKFFHESIQGNNAITQELFNQMGLYTKLYTAFQLGAFIATKNLENSVEWKSVD